MDISLAIRIAPAAFHFNRQFFRNVWTYAWSCSLFADLFLVELNVAVGQGLRPAESDSVKLPKNVVPNLSRQSDRFRLLDNRSIRMELRVSIDKYRELQKLKRELYNQKGQSSSSNSAHIPAMVETAISLLMTPDQIDRLNQLSHYVEIAYLGLDGALVQGRLGSMIGVTENQRTALAERSKRILDTAAADVRALRIDAQNRALLALDK